MILVKSRLAGRASHERNNHTTTVSICGLDYHRTTSKADA